MTMLKTNNSLLRIGNFITWHFLLLLRFVQLEMRCKCLDTEREKEKEFLLLLWKLTDKIFFFYGLGFILEWNFSSLNTRVRSTLRELISVSRPNQTLAQERFHTKLPKYKRSTADINPITSCCSGGYIHLSCSQASGVEKISLSPKSGHQHPKNSISN